MTDRYEISVRVAIVHITIRTISLRAYASAKYGLLLHVSYAAIKLVVTDIVLGTIFAVLKYSRTK